MDLMTHAFALLAYLLIGFVCVQRVVEHVKANALSDYDYFVMSIHMQRRSLTMLLPLILLLAGWPVFMAWVWYRTRQHNPATA